MHERLVKTLSLLGSYWPFLGGAS